MDESVSLTMISIEMGVPFDAFDQLVKSSAAEAGAEFVGTGSGGGARDYYLRATSEQLNRIVRSLRQAGARIVDVR